MYAEVVLGADICRLDVYNQPLKDDEQYVMLFSETEEVLIIPYRKLEHYDA